MLGKLEVKADPETVCCGEGTELTATSSDGPYKNDHAVAFTVEGPDGPISTWGHSRTTDTQGEAVLAKNKSDDLLNAEGDYIFKVENPKHEEDTVEVKVIDISKGTVEAKRTSTPSESQYPIKEGEHFEVGGTFEFLLEGPDDYNDLPIAWRVEQLDYLNSTLDSGSGDSGSYTFQSGSDVGRVDVKFFVDRDGDEDIDGDECRLSSPEFTVVEMTTHDITIEYSTALGSLSLGVVQSEFNSSVEYALRKDSEDDWRACFEIAVGSLTSFAPDPSTRPDPCLSSSDEDLHLNTGHFVLVLQLSGGNRGVARLGSPGAAIDWDAKVADTIVHEFGHNRGLGGRDSAGNDHAGYTPSQIMCRGPSRNMPPEGELQAGDVGAFE